MDKNSKIFVAGHNGLVGSALVRKLNADGYYNIVTVDKSVLNLTNQSAVYSWFMHNKPEYVFLAAAKVGGIVYNESVPAEFALDNILIQTNVIDAAYKHNCKKLLFLGSSCIYPKYAPQPITEDALLTSKLEPTNEAYALAKIMGLKLCQFYRKQYGFDAISIMPTNLYGINDNFHPLKSHVIPGMINRFTKAKEDNAPEVVCWGDGSPKREFLYVDDLADACIFLMQNYSDYEHVNAGSEDEVTIKDLAEIVKDAVGYTGSISWDTSKPNGTPQKKLDNTKLKKLGWEPKHTFKEGMQKTVEWFNENKERFA